MRKPKPCPWCVPDLDFGFVGEGNQSVYEPAFAKRENPMERRIASHELNWMERGNVTGRGNSWRRGQPDSRRRRYSAGGRAPLY